MNLITLTLHPPKPAQNQTQHSVCTVCLNDKNYYVLLGHYQKLRSAKLILMYIKIHLLYSCHKYKKVGQPKQFLVSLESVLSGHSRN